MIVIENEKSSGPCWLYSSLADHHQLGLQIHGAYELILVGFEHLRALFARQGEQMGVLYPVPSPPLY